MGFFIKMLFCYWFYKIGSKRIMGGFTSFWWVFLIWPIGIIFVLTSRRLDDEKRDRELIEKYKVVKVTS